MTKEADTDYFDKLFTIERHAGASGDGRDEIRLRFNPDLYLREPERSDGKTEDMLRSLLAAELKRFAAYLEA